MSKGNKCRLGTAVHAFNPVPENQRQADLCALEATLVCTVTHAFSASTGEQREMDQGHRKEAGTGKGDGESVSNGPLLFGQSRKSWR